MIKYVLKYRKLIDPDLTCAAYCRVVEQQCLTSPAYAVAKENQERRLYQQGSNLTIQLSEGCQEHF